MLKAKSMLIAVGCVCALVAPSLSAPMPIPPLLILTDQHTYVGTAVPDGAEFSAWSVNAASWSAAAGELTMSTSSGSGIWFGHHPFYDPVAWPLAPTLLYGNSVHWRAKLAPASGDWEIWLIDDLFEAHMTLNPGVVTYYDAANPVAGIAHPLNTEQYHWYEILLSEGRVEYWVDGAMVFTGLPMPTGGGGSFYAMFGDTTTMIPLNTGYGSVVVDEAEIRVYGLKVPEPGTLSMLVLGGLIVSRRRRR